MWTERNDLRNMIASHAHETGYIRRLQQEDILSSLALHKIISLDDKREQLLASYHLFPSFPWRIGRVVRVHMGAVSRSLKEPARVDRRNRKCDRMVWFGRLDRF